MLQSEPKPLQAEEDWRQLLLRCPQWAFWKGILSIPPHLWSPQDSLLLPLSFFFSHGIAFKIKHPPTWSFRAKTLISRIVLGFLAMAQDLEYPTCHDQHNFPADPAVKTTTFSGCVCWPSHKETAQLIRPPHLLHLIGPLRADISSGLTPFCFIATCISGFKCVGQNSWRTLLHALTRPKTSSNPVNNQANDEHTPSYIRGRYGYNTYCSLLT